MMVPGEACFRGCVVDSPPSSDMSYGSEAQLTCGLTFNLSLERARARKRARARIS
jgi:hypothetical protein